MNCPGECGEVIELKHLLDHQRGGSCTAVNTSSMLHITVQQLLDSPPGSGIEQQAMGKLVEKFIPSGGPTIYRSTSGKVGWPIRSMM